MSKKRSIIIGIIVFIVLVITGLLSYFVFPNKFELKNGNIILNYGEKYQEPGYKFTRFKKDYTKDVKISSNINEKKLGTYKVTYTVKINGLTFKKTRTVKIIDKEKPKITLTGNVKTDVCPETDYKEEGYKATDNYDKNITKKVKVKINKDKIIYTVSDSSGNKSEVIRELTYQDKTKPELALNGNETNVITLNEGYSEEGATAIDNCDGDITKNITKTGSVDTSKIGNYEISYQVKDSSGNESIIKRTVSVIEKANLNSGIPGVIYLTFDDGPREGTTNVILDILKEEDVKATFFVTNSGPDYLIKREYDEGHTVALHTSTHNYSVVYASDDAFYADLEAVQNRVKRITGETSMIIRFPGGSSNTVSKKYSEGIMTRLTQSTLAKGYKYYDWNISSGDAGETTEASGVYNNVVSNLKKDRPNMILMHDIKPYTRDALKQIIQFGKENGYKFEKITMDTTMIAQRVNN